MVEVTNDVIKEIDNLPIRAQAELTTARLTLQTASSFTVEIRRSTSDLVYTYDLI